MSLNSPNALRYKFSSPKTTTKKKEKKGKMENNLKRLSKVRKNKGKEGGGG